MTTVITSKGDQARAEILTAAKRLFLSQGYGSTSMRNIAEAAGKRAVGGIYNHFEGKQAIFEALIAERNPFEEIMNLVASGEGDTASAYITSIIKEVIPLIERNYEFLELVQIDLREFQGENVKRFTQNNVLPTALVIIQRIQTLPGFKPHEPIVLLRMMASTVMGYVLSKRIMPPAIVGQLTEDEWIASYLDMVLNGIVNEPE